MSYCQFYKQHQAEGWLNTTEVKNITGISYPKLIFIARRQYVRSISYNTLHKEYFLFHKNSIPALLKLKEIILKRPKIIY